MNSKSHDQIQKLALTALFAALCYVIFTFLQIKIPMPGGDATSLHLGNAFCVLAALLLGGGYGGLAGAVGMTIADLMDPVYITGAPKTFILKFCIGLITGLVAHKIAHISESTDKKIHLQMEPDLLHRRSWLQCHLRSAGWLLLQTVHLRPAPGDGFRSCQMEHRYYFCKCRCFHHPGRYPL